jgi:hypothetical protein
MGAAGQQKRLDLSDAAMHGTYSLRGIHNQGDLSVSTDLTNVWKIQ